MNPHEDSVYQLVKSEMTFFRFFRKKDKRFLGMVTYTNRCVAWGQMFLP